MNRTKIEWTDASLNPIRARRIDGSNRVPGHFCQKISPGCAHCYSSRMQVRFGMPEFPGVTRSPESLGLDVYMDVAVLMSILRRKKPGRVFWCDMTDLFGAWVPDEWIDMCFAAMALTPHLTHQVLTKRPERMCAYFAGKSVEQELWVDRAAKDGGIERVSKTIHLPLPNVWLGTSVENQETADERIPHLLRVPAAVRFLSCEPLLGAINLMRSAEGFPCGPVNSGCCPGVSWVIVGGESGPGARPCDVAWIRSIVRQCCEASVPVFVKQLGSVPVMDEVEWRAKGCGPLLTVRNHKRCPEGMVPLATADRKGGDMASFPVDLRVRQFPA